MTETVTLPNGLVISEINPYETKFLYKEIFIDESYLKHGITLPGDAVVLDVGANIGLFSLFCLGKAPNARILAVEPAPHCLACLEHNIAANGGLVEVIRAAAVDVAGPQKFTYYPKYSIMSGILADRQGDTDILRKGAARLLGIDPDSPGARKMIDMLVSGKLKDAVEFTCDAVTVSDLIDAHGLTRIDLLKVDVEKAEAMVLAGIAERHWAAVRQIVLEAHDLGHGEHETIKALLESKGFQVVMEATDNLSSSGIYSLYARRT